MAFLVMTDDELEALVETKVQAVLRRPTTPSRRPRRRPTEVQLAKSWMPRFLRLLRICGNVSEAVDQLREEGGPCRSTVYRGRDQDPEFGRVGRHRPELAEEGSVMLDFSRFLNLDLSRFLNLFERLVLALEHLSEVLPHVVALRTPRIPDDAEVDWRAVRDELNLTPEFGRQWAQGWLRRNQ